MGRGYEDCCLCIHFFFFLGAVLHLIPTIEHYEVSLFLDNALYSDYRLVMFLSQMIFRAQSTTYRLVLPKTNLLFCEMCRWYKTDSSPHKV